MSLLFIDSETCGLHSMMVLLQYAEDDGPIHLYNVWKEPVWKTLELLEWIAQNTVVGFNLAFDWFHVVKIHTIWSLLPQDWIPEEHIEEIAMMEPKGRDGLCLKPAAACDLLLHSRKNQYQALMAREDIRIRRVPTVLAYSLADELEKRVQIDGIFFARSKDPEAPRWKVYDIFKKNVLDEDFKDVVLKFKPAGGLKFLAEYALGFVPKFHFSDVELDKSYRPVELGYAPMALAISSPEKGWEVEVIEKKKARDGKTLKKIKKKGFAWPAKIQAHIDHWAMNEPAREYASDDILYTRELYKHFGSPAAGDDDSTLACMVPIVRWRGFEIDREGMEGLLQKAQDTVANAPCNINKPTAVRAYLTEVMDEIEAVFIEDTTKKAKLEGIATWTADDDLSPHPAAIRARAILNVKHASKEIELYNKLLIAGRFHASFNVIGTMSSRMSGGDGLNAQAIKKTKEVRKNFPLKWDGYELCGGDFDAFEVTLADAVYNDPQLRKALVTFIDCHKCKATGKVKPLCKSCKELKKAKKELLPDCPGCALMEDEVCGGCEGAKKTTKKIHGLFGMALFPGKTYEEILASEGTDHDMYTMAKSGVFAMIYGGNAETLHRNLGIPLDVAQAAYEMWGKMFPGIEKARQRIFRNFCSMRQPDGRQVLWEDPADYCETFLGFRRYFTLENKICRELYRMAQSPPKEWKSCPAKVVRRQRVQTAGGAVSSALYGAAFSLQQTNMRAAANHEIQSPGGEITKRVQRKIWDLQPAGLDTLFVAPMNIHDELECVTHPSYIDPVAEAVREGVESYRAKVALIGMTWNKGMLNWAEKKGGSVTVKIKPPELQNAV